VVKAQNCKHIIFFSQNTSSGKMKLSLCPSRRNIHLPKTEKPSRNSRHQTGDMKQVPYWEAINVRRHSDLAHGISIPSAYCKCK